MNKLTFSLLYYFFIVIISSGAIAKDIEFKTYNIYGKTMGNNYRITWDSDNTTPEQVYLLRKKIELRLEEINASMSTWRQDSEISKINAYSGNDAIQISPPLAEVLAKAIAIAKMTDGALDITIAPLVELWGFGPSSHPRQIPSANEIKQVLQYTGLNNITLAGTTLTKRDPRTRLDLSSIAKGYGVDEIARLLRQEGIEHFLVDIGGELVTHGKRFDGQLWQVAVDKPELNSRDQVATLSISDKAIATSGDYRNFFEQDNIHFSHIINPKTGRSVQRQVISATVIADDCATADALATATVVMGVKPALAMAERLGLPLMLIENHAGEITFHHSKAFQEYLN